MSFALSTRRYLKFVGRSYHVFNRNVYYQTDGIKYNIERNDLEKWKIRIEKKIQELEMRIKALEVERNSRQKCELTGQKCELTGVHRNY